MKRSIYFLTTLVFVLTSSVFVNAQTTEEPADPVTIELGFSPEEGTVFPEDSMNLITVNVLNFAAVTNLTVTATYTSDTGEVEGTLEFEATGDAAGDFEGTFVVPPDLSSATPVFFEVTAIGNDITLTNELDDPNIDPENPPAPEYLPESETTGTVNFSYQIVTRPENEFFDDAYKFQNQGGIFSSSNNWARLETGEPTHADETDAGASVWWNWSIGTATNVFIDTSGSSFEPVLAVYTGDDVMNLLSVASSTNDIVNGLKANVSFAAEAGRTYRIAVASLPSTNVGDIQLRVFPGGQPDIIGPEVSILSPADDSLFTTNLVSFTGLARDEGEFDTGVSRVFLQVNGDAPVEATGTLDWLAQLDLPPGTNTISAFAEDVAGNIGLTNVISVAYVNPTNAAFASAITLEGTSGFDLAMNERAYKETGEPIHSENEGGRSIWYKWTAPADGVLQLSTAGSDHDTLMSVYTGVAINSLNLVAHNDDANWPDDLFSYVEFPTIEGETYYIAIDGYAQYFGFVQLNYVFTPFDPNGGGAEPGFVLVSINSSGGGTVDPAGGQYLEETTVEFTAIPFPGVEFVGWEGSNPSADNPLSIFLNGNKTLIPIFEIVDYTDDFETGDFSKLPWQFSGDVGWSIFPPDGESDFEAQSGTPGPSQTSSLILDYETGEGFGSFDFRTSTERNWDFLNFYVDGQLIQRWSGEAGFNTFSFQVDAGIHTFEWRYTKDGSFDVGTDHVAIDNLFLPPAEAGMDEFKQPEIQITSISGNVVLSLMTEKQLNYRAEWSTDLEEPNWQLLPEGLFKGDGDLMSIPDTLAGNEERFYRVIMLNK